MKDKRNSIKQYINKKSIYIRFKTGKKKRIHHISKWFYLESSSFIVTLNRFISALTSQDWFNPNFKGYSNYIYCGTFNDTIWAHLQKPEEVARVGYTEQPTNLKIVTFRITMIERSLSVFP